MYLLHHPPFISSKPYYRTTQDPKPQKGSCPARSRHQTAPPSYRSLDPALLELIDHITTFNLSTIFQECFQQEKNVPSFCSDHNSLTNYLTSDGLWYDSISMNFCFMNRIKMLIVLVTVNDRDSRRREIPAPGELFLPGPGPGRFSIFAGNLAGNFWSKSA